MSNICISRWLLHGTIIVQELHMALVMVSWSCWYCTKAPLFMSMLCWLFCRSNWLVLRPGVWLATKLAKVGMSLVMGMLVQYAICKGFVPKAYGLGGYIERAMILFGASALRLWNDSKIYLLSKFILSCPPGPRLSKYCPIDPSLPPCASQAVQLIFFCLPVPRRLSDWSFPVSLVPRNRHVGWYLIDSLHFQCY